MAKIHPKLQFLNPRKSAHDIAASAVPRIARGKVDAHSVSMPARIAGRLTAVVGTAGDQIKSARRLGFEILRTVRHENRANQFHSQSNSHSDTSSEYVNIIVVLSIDVSNCVPCILLSVDDLRELKEMPPRSV